MQKTSQSPTGSRLVLDQTWPGTPTQFPELFIPFTGTILGHRPVEHQPVDRCGHVITELLDAGRRYLRGLTGKTAAASRTNSSGGPGRGGGGVQVTGQTPSLLDQNARTPSGLPNSIKSNPPIKNPLSQYCSCR